MPTCIDDRTNCAQQEQPKERSTERNGTELFWNTQRCVVHRSGQRLLIYILAYSYPRVPGPQTSRIEQTDRPQ